MPKCEVSYCSAADYLFLVLSANFSEAFHSCESISIASDGCRIRRIFSMCDSPMEAGIPQDQAFPASVTAAMLMFDASGGQNALGAVQGQGVFGHARAPPAAATPSHKASRIPFRLI